jgi:ComEC/Rec2-related protein
MLSEKKLCFCAFQVMLIIVLLLFLSYILFQVRLSVFAELIYASKPLHQFCLNLLPSNPKTQATLQALVCGHNFESFEVAQVFTSSGLIHLFVVSGSHLLLIHKALDFILKKIAVTHSQKYVWCILFFYTAVCLFNPPVTRGFIGLVLFSYLKNTIKYWPTDFVLILVGLMCLLFSPTWVSSLSLQMSWLAALGINFYQRYLKNKNRLIQQIPFYIFYSATFSALGFPQVSVIVIALIFTPVLEYILLPMAFLVLAFPCIDYLFEITIGSLVYILSYFELSVSRAVTPFENTVLFNWLLIFSIHFLLHFNRKKT